MKPAFSDIAPKAFSLWLRTPSCEFLLDVVSNATCNRSGLWLKLGFAQPVESFKVKLLFGDLSTRCGLRLVASCKLLSPVHRFGG